MSEARAETVCQGLAAAQGLAIGRIVLHDARRPRGRVSGGPEQQRAALRAAIETAGRELQALAAAADELARDILEFQTALLEDEDLIDPILAAVAAGQPADEAWSKALDREIAEYRAGEDEVFRARGADLADLRDRVLEALCPTSKANGERTAEAAIYAADDLTPSRFLETDWRRYLGAALRGGSPRGHVALLARARGTPLIVSLGERFDHLRDGALAVLDGEGGRLILDPGPGTVAETTARLRQSARSAAAHAHLLDQPAITASGERVWVDVNADDPALLQALDPAHCDGIGLTRTEFLFRGEELPDEERQYRAYRDILGWARGRPVVIRTLDAGGDKPIAGLTPEGESNPFLGLRGLRLSLARPDVLRVQLRALARAAALGRLKVMAPMVSEPGEFAAFRRLFEEVVQELQAAGVEASRPALGMMVEVPAAALDIARFEADFYSIGSNDLIQYVMAADRDNPSVAALYDPRNPAVLELIGRVVAGASAQGREVSLCGEMASEPAQIGLLLDAGLRHLSVAPAAIGAIKAAIAAWRPGSSGEAAIRTRGA
jgi:phosphotransferase system enzyme I (PtsI)